MVDEVKWRYKVGTHNLVAQQPDSKQKHVIGLARLLGYDNFNYEKDKSKSWSSRYLQIYPRLVADFIRHADWYKTAPLHQIAEENQRLRKEMEEYNEREYAKTRKWRYPDDIADGIPAYFPD